MNTEMYVFDQDGTLSESKRPVSVRMAGALARLLESHRVAVISGADFPQIRRQVVSRLPKKAKLENLYLIPVNGGEAWEYRKKWQKIYAETLTPQERERLRKAVSTALAKNFERPEKKWGNTLDYRGVQVTYSALGQKAPLQAKKGWDADRLKRKAMIRELKKFLPGYEFGIGGLTSIDITPRGITKPAGIFRLARYLRVSKDKIFFTGDAIFPGGNDYAVKRAGIRSTKVSAPKDTYALIRKMVSRDRTQK
jgi:HAD superfamily hydrolase (TIGR01484 family)